MKIRNIMTTDVATCRPDTDLATAATLMWHHDCGFMPVVDAVGALAGVVTDRDICIASATRGLTPAHIAASEVMSHRVHACMADDDVSEALATMKQFQVRRLPVIDASGRLKGVVSMNDMVIASQRSKGPAAKEVLSTLSGICAHRSVAAATV